MRRGRCRCGIKYGDGNAGSRQFTFVRANSSDAPTHFGGVAPAPRGAERLDADYRHPQCGRNDAFFAF